MGDLLTVEAWMEKIFLQNFQDCPMDRQIGKLLGHGGMAY
jgi:hypothetical protein